MPQHALSWEKQKLLILREPMALEQSGHRLGQAVKLFCVCHTLEPGLLGTELSGFELLGYFPCCAWVRGT